MGRTEVWAAFYFILFRPTNSVSKLDSQAFRLPPESAETEKLPLWATMLVAPAFPHPPCLRAPN